MNNGRRIFTTAAAIVATICIAATALANGTAIRWLQMGEYEGGTNNSTVSLGYDTPISGDPQQIDLNVSGSPVYRTITGRPDGGGGIGVDFDSAQSQYMYGQALNWPEASPWSDSNSGFYNLQGIDDRGFQFWVHPTSTAAQSLVMDTNRHGVRINSSGKFSMRYANVDYDTSISAVPNTWYHLELVRPAGISSRSRLYVNGVAAAISAAVDYPSDTVTNMTVGAATAGDGEYFKGIIDDLKMSVYGQTTSGLATNYGTWDFATDNAYAASSVTGLSGVAGDVTNDGSLTPADATAFVAGWMHTHLVSGVQIGDMFSHSEGDLNLDGITNIYDLLLMQNALSSASLPLLTSADFTTVPEPATIVSLTVWLLSLPLRRRRRAC